MKKAHLVIFAVLALVAALAIGPAYAADKGGVYVGIKGGYEYKDHNKGDVADSTAAPNNNNATNQSWSEKSGYTIGGAIGYNFAGMGLPVRAEAEYLYHNQFKYSADNATSGGLTGTFNSKIDIHTVFANFYYDIKTSTAFTPYVGAGLGVAWINQKVTSTFRNWAPGTSDGNYDTTNFAWNVGAGVGYSLTDNIIIDLGYRYTSFGDAKNVEQGAISFQAKDLKSHEALLGLRYQF
ncbi:MAG: outer membrane beta-barrel protein [Humidesulfovibrio sp.]|nr:outer membrane beta-barrel protein [Humidesulfovibrio sp.]